MQFYGYQKPENMGMKCDTQQIKRKSQECKNKENNQNQENERMEAESPRRARKMESQEQDLELEPKKLGGGL